MIFFCSAHTQRYEVQKRDYGAGGRADVDGGFAQLLKVQKVLLIVVFSLLADIG